LPFAVIKDRDLRSLSIFGKEAFEESARDLLSVKENQKQTNNV